LSRTSARFAKANSAKIYMLVWLGNHHLMVWPNAEGKAALDLISSNHN
jgi:hypothetical protein